MGLGVGAPTLRGEGLAGGASCEKMSGILGPHALDVGAPEISNRRLVECGSQICLEWVTAYRVDVNARADFDTSLHEPEGQSACSAEEINGLNLGGCMTLSSRYSPLP